MSYSTIYIDVDTGVAQRSDGSAYPQLNFYTRDIYTLNIVYLSSGVNITNTVLANNAIQRIGIASLDSESVLLASAITYTLSNSIASANLSLNTQELVNYFINNVPVQNKSAQFLFEIEVSSTDESVRKTYHQSTITIFRDVNVPGGSTVTGIPSTYLLKSALYDSNGNSISPNLINFRPDITGASGGGTNLDAVSTASATKPMVFITFYGNKLRPWILTTSTGTPVTTSGITVPLDWNASTNNVQWTELAFS
jgi:hypothetical protein